MGSYAGLADSEDEASTSMTRHDTLRRRESIELGHIRQRSSGDERRLQDDEFDEEEAEILGLIHQTRRVRSPLPLRDEENKEPQSSDEAPIFRDSEEFDLDSAASLVRRVVPENDDPTLPALTFRVLLIGTTLCILGAAVSQLFFFKSNAPSFSSFFIILIAYPLGKWLASALPDDDYSIFGWRFTLNPGPFNKKEHLLISVLAGSGASAAYAGEIISVQELYYHQDLGTFGGLLLLLSTQLIGFGLSGFLYRLLVRPTAMLWPSTLVFVTMYETLHGNAKTSVKDTKDRMRFFNFSFVSIFTWQFLPALVFPTLTSIAVLCLINNQSLIMRTFSSGYDGFGFLNFSLDWSAIGSTGPLYTPFFASASYFLGLAVNMWIVAPLLYFGDFWSARSFDSPLAAHLYNSTFGRLDITEILNPDLSLNEERFAEVGPLLLTPYFAVSYGISFAILTAAVVTVMLWNWKDIKQAFSAREATGDIHVEMLERSYPPIPRKYYAIVFCSMFGCAAVLVTFYPMQLPVWGLFLALLLAVVFLVPVGIIAAVTNTTLGLNVISELVAGFIWPGKPIANIVFKTLSYMTLVQCLDLTADLKLGLYCKIPPRKLFICQVYGTALGSVVNYSLIRSVIAAKRPYLDGTVIDPSGQWSGRKPEIFFVASVAWGLVAPARFFSGQYAWLYLGFPIGAILPIIPWYMYKRRGNTFWRKVSVPLILHGAIAPPQTPTNILIPGFLASFLSQFYALRYRPRWFEKYCYVLSSALDAGTSINALVIYLFGLSSFVTWWGNPALDAEHCLPGS